MPLADAVALGHQEAGRLTYGRVRMWGSIAYVCLSLIGGLILSRFGPNGIWASMVLFASAMIAASVFQRTRRRARSITSVRASANFTARFTGSRLGLVLVASALIDSTHSLYYNFATIEWRSLGFSGTTIGFLWAIGVVAEVMVLASAGRWLRRSSGLPFIAVAGCAAIARWALLSLDLPLPLLFVVQLSHCLTYAANLLGVMTFIARNAPPKLAGSIQGTYAALASGFFAAGAMALSGRLYASYGAHAYLAMSAIAVIGLCVLATAWRQERVAAPAPV